MTEELKPCPFCGGTNCGVRAGTDQIWCVCGGHSPYGWNSRPIEDKLRAENERLREALEEIVDYQVYRFRLLPHQNELLEKVVEIAHNALTALNEVTK